VPPQLRGCHLNLLRGVPELAPSYQLTEPTAEQRAILTSLRLADLVDHDALQTRLHPRARVSARRHGAGSQR